MIERIPARPRRLNEHLEVGARLLLADEFVERLRADRRLVSIRLALRARDEAVRHRAVPPLLFVIRAC